MPYNIFFIVSFYYCVVVVCCCYTHHPHFSKTFFNKNITYMYYRYRCGTGTTVQPEPKHGSFVYVVRVLMIIRLLHIPSTLFIYTNS
jgi:hypothetical protein